MTRLPGVLALEEFAGTAEVDAAQGTWVPWADAFSPAEVDDVLASHADATSTPLRVAGTLAASRLVAALARVQAGLLTERGDALLLDPRSLWLERTPAGEIGDRLATDTARIVSHDAPTVASRTVDALIDACVTDLSGPSRVSSRVLASAAAFAWLAGIRGASTRRPGSPEQPADLLWHQWRSRHPLSKIVRELFVPRPDQAPVRFLVRRACCLEYTRDVPGQRTYCPSCPLIPEEALITRRAEVLTGERPRDFHDCDRHAVAG